MVRGGVAVAALAMAGCAIASEFWMFVLARVLLGLGSGVVSPAIRRLVIVRDPERVGANLGQQMAFDMAGFVLGPLVTAVLAEVLGVRVPFWVLAGLFAVVLVHAWRLDLDSGAEPVQKRVVRGLLALRPMQSALAASVAFYVTIGVFEAVWAVLLRDRGADTWLIGLTLSLFTVPMIFLAPLGGRAAQSRGPLPVVMVSITVAAACSLSYGFAPLWLLLAVSLVHAFADSFTMPANQVAVAMAAGPQQAAAGQGLLGASGLAVAGAVGLIAGAVYETAGRATLFVSTAVVMLVALAVAWSRGSDLRRPVPAAVAEAVVAAPPELTP